MKEFLDFKINSKTNMIEDFKNFTDTIDCPAVSVDLSNVNIFEAMRFIVTSSAYHYCKYPEGKLKCLIGSDDVKTFISSFCTSNLELV